MAKKKKRKVEKKSGFAHSAELFGVLFILAAILGVGKYGPVGKLFSSFCVFLVGTGYAFLLVIFFILGIYLIVKREWPKFLTTKLVGLYILALGLLVWAHESYLTENAGDIGKIIQDTLNQLVASFSSGSSAQIELTGGGIIGCLFAGLFYKLFDYQGMVIVRWTLMIIGVTLFTGFSIVDFVKNSAEKGKEVLSKGRGKKDSSVEAEDRVNKKVIISGVTEEEEGHKDAKKVITSLAEVTSIEDKEEKKEVAPSPSVVLTNSNYRLPPHSLLEPPKKSAKGVSQASIEKNVLNLEKVLHDFEINGKVVEAHVGPTVTQYELEVQSGTRVSRILSISREIALALAKRDVRIEAPIPGKNTVGIEIPNDVTTAVTFKEVLEKVPSNKDDSKLLAPLGKNIMGAVDFCEIDKTPHLLVAGSTGSGKSVCINGIICSILMRAKPDEVRMILVDPKQVEFSVYNGIPHLMCPVVTDPSKAAQALKKVVVEMEQRYHRFSETKTKNLSTYNQYVEQENMHRPEGEKLSKMPYIVVIVDELADLMLVARKEVEDSIMRITQMARAAGIHLIIATQRPSTDVITGLIKSNIPSRISFYVSSSIDSRTILDMTGAEKLLGKGDMLFLPMGSNAPTRIQGVYISDDEIKRIADWTIKQQVAQYDESMMNLNPNGDGSKSASQLEDASQVEEYDDPLYNEIVEFVISTQKASASLLQRRFKLGYNRAARIVDLLEERGIIGPQNGSKPREVLVQLENTNTEQEENEE